MNNNSSLAFLSPSFPEVRISPPWAPLILSGGVLAIAYTALLNAAIVYCICLRPSTRHSVNYLYASIAMSNLLFGGLNICLQTLYSLYESWPLGLTWCIIFSVSDFVSGTISSISFAVLAVFQFLAISAPFCGQRWKESSSTLALLLLIWLLPTFIWTTNNTFLYLNSTLEPNVCDITSPTIFIILSSLLVVSLPLTIVLIFSVATAMKITRKNRRRESLVNSLDAPHTADISSLYRMEEQLSIQSSREMKSIIVLVVNFLIFLCCWLPTIMLWCVAAFTTTPITMTSTNVIYWLHYFHVAIQPTALIILNDNLREALKQSLRCRATNQSPEAHLHVNDVLQFQ